MIAIIALRKIILVITTNFYDSWIWCIVSLEGQVCRLFCWSLPQTNDHGTVEQRTAFLCRSVNSPVFMNAGMYITVSLNSELPIFFCEVEHLCLLILQFLHILHTPFIGLACLKSIASVKEWYGLGGVWLLLCCGWLFCELPSWKQSHQDRRPHPLQHNIELWLQATRMEFAVANVYPPVSR